MVINNYPESMELHYNGVIYTSDTGDKGMRVIELVSKAIAMNEKSRTQWDC